MKSQNETSENLWTYSTTALRTEAKVNDYTQAQFAKRCPMTTHQKRVCVTSKKTHKTNQFLPRPAITPLSAPPINKPQKGITYAGAHFYHKRR
ncbi:hypothetical protein CDAR_462061 [Caerostris darwini]|uniref:Uncharacterized protein n=1 Tax=Caerostris darwini TaxID=1538125 RepID=A0AAV4QTV6_9ARAC|nr:hypothetical protein CDAR_462061 [Caerostris darwini]